MNREFKDAIENSPIIAAIKNDAELHQCLTCDSQVIFILYGDLCNIADIVDTVKSAGKIALVHLDLIGGLNAKEIAVDFIKKYTRADGIISTRPDAKGHLPHLRSLPGSGHCRRTDLRQRRCHADDPGRCDLDLFYQ